MRPTYTFGAFLWDLFLTFITSGLYLLWRIFKFMYIMSTRRR